MYDWYILSSGIPLFVYIYIYICIYMHRYTYTHPRYVRSITLFLIIQNSKTPWYRGPHQGSRKCKKKPNALGIKEGPGSTLTTGSWLKICFAIWISWWIPMEITQSHTHIVKLLRFYVHAFRKRRDFFGFTVHCLQALKFGTLFLQSHPISSGSNAGRISSWLST